VKPWKENDYVANLNAMEVQAAHASSLPQGFL
jgi:hypothetical protein